MLFICILVYFGVIAFQGFAETVEYQLASDGDQSQQVPLSRALVDLNNGLQIYQCKRGIFLISDKDTIISQSLKLWGAYDDKSLNLLLHLVEPGHIVIDVGANIGTFAIPLASKVSQQSSGRVYAFEAVQLNYQRLVANAAINHLSTSLYAYQYAMDSEQGRYLEIPMANDQADGNFGNINLLQSADTLSKLRSKQADVHALSERLVTHTLDSFASENLVNECPRLIKIDVETMELPVLKGGQELIKRCKPIVHAENNCVKNSKPLLDFFHLLNYVCYWDVNLLPYPDFSDDVMVSINILCLSQDRLFVQKDESEPAEPALLHELKTLRVADNVYTRIEYDRPYLSQYDGFDGHAQEGSMESCMSSTWSLP